LVTTHLLLCSCSALLAAHRRGKRKYGFTVFPRVIQHGDCTPLYYGMQYVCWMFSFVLLLMMKDVQHPSINVILSSYTVLICSLSSISSICFLNKFRFQIQGLDGVFAPVEPMNGAVLLICGDALQRCTADKLIAVVCIYNTQFTAVQKHHL
jgi:hypothetical protein